MDMRFLIFLILLFPSIQARGTEGEMCKNTGQIWMPFEQIQWVELDRQIAKEAIRKDFKGFCEWNRMDRAVKRKDLPEYRSIKATGDRAAAAKKISRFSSSEWHGSMLGHPILKLNVGTEFNLVCPDPTIDNIAISCAANISDALAQNYPHTNYSLPDYQVKENKPSGSATKLQAACIAFSPKNMLDCGSATEDLLEHLKIYSGLSENAALIVGVPFLQEVLADKRITSALKNLSVKLWRKIEKKEFEENANIFSDLNYELMGAGFSLEEARKKSLQILGAISTGGPNFYLRVNSEEIISFPKSCKEKPGCNLNGIYLQAIAEGMVHADTYKMMADAPAPYSLPGGSDFQCDIGKSYHFWFSAALTDRLMEQGHQANAARAAVFAAQVGYQLGGADSERGKNALAMPRYGSVENGIRMDLNLAAAGTVFGAQINNPPDVLPLKDGLLKTIDAGNTTPFSSDTEFHLTTGNVMEWMDRVGAKAAFGSYP